MINDIGFFTVLWGNCINYARVERSFQGVLTVAAKSLQSDRVVHGVEQQPEGVQLVEGVGLVRTNVFVLEKPWFRVSEF